MNIQMQIDEETLQDIINIETGLFYPLDGFMREGDFHSVVNQYVLQNGQVFPLPITLAVPEDIYGQITGSEVIDLMAYGECVAQIQAESRFKLTGEDIKSIYATLDDRHPGVAREKGRSPFRVGGRSKLLKRELLEEALKPEEVKRVFWKRGWKTAAGFQTRNPVHKAHEYIQRLGLEICDGLFINPITGWKKKGDFTEEAVMAAYKEMFCSFYPPDRVYIAGLKTQMRYAGPREAVFHALIRRNLGCTHFIIGRDHAGVGSYYGEYDAHRLARQLQSEYGLGIELLLTREPYFCRKCGQLVTDRTCSHYFTDRTEISGTIIRGYIHDGKIPDEIMMRNEIFHALLGCKQIFIE